MSSYKILTPYGTINPDMLEVGDTVLEYKTGRHLTISYITEVFVTRAFDVTYGDDITIRYGCRENIFTGNRICEAYQLTPEDRYYDVKTYPVVYNKNITRPLTPDPYVAGALLIYGDQNDEFINLPIDRVQVNNQLSHMYNIDYYPLAKDGKVYFQYKGKQPAWRITWKEFFDKYYYFRGNTGDMDAKLVPIEYIMSSFDDRIQFLRGVFDTGYMYYNRKSTQSEYDDIVDLSPDVVSIQHSSLECLQVVQYMLGSIGIISTIVELPKLSEKRPYTLQIRTDRLKYYPGFFYWFPNIQKMVDSDYTIQKLDPIHNNDITEINEVEVGYKWKEFQFIGNGSDKRNKYALYMTDEWIPRIGKF